MAVDSFVILALICFLYCSCYGFYIAFDMVVDTVLYCF